MDYEKLGFKCGIEIHQELNTKKLFCQCSTALKEENKSFEVKRKLRAVAGEAGKIDIASQYEFLKDREFIYSGYFGEACLVDTDEEPPQPVNEEALDIALGVAKILKLNVPDSLCVMRKTITDGSAVSGFQRTILVAMEGKESYLPESKVKILQLNLEEDACKIEKKDGNISFYSLSRQGIPLVELGTDATIKDPQHAKEVASEIGMLLRSFNVKRGIGTIRQDVNVSIKEGARVEVKGWQDLKSLPLLVENEVSRQVALVEIKKELEKLGVKKFEKKEDDATEIFKSSTNKIITAALKDNGKIIALLLPKFGGLLKKEVCPGKTFGRELSEYAKAHGTKGMIHTDEDLAKYGLVNEFEKLKKEIHAKPDDLIIVFAEGEKIAKAASNSVYERALYCLKGIPEETRIPNHENATSSYARPLPGAHRLYPETDSPMIDASLRFKKIKIPQLLAEKIKRLNKEYNIEEHILKDLFRDGIDIEELISKYKNIDAKLLASIIIEIPKEAKKRYNVEINTIDSPQVFEKLNGSEITRDAVLEIFIELGKGNNVDYTKYKAMDEHSLEKEIKKIIAENKSAPPNAMIGIVMAKMRGKADGKRIVELVKKFS
ncbi:MAG: Glu-tRNA(Gln) amidotransferase subunit GatE [archaeon]